MAHRDNLLLNGVDWVMRAALRKVPPASWAEKLALWWGFRHRAAARVVRLRGGPKMLIEPSDYLLIWIYYLGTFEPHCLKWLPRLLPEGGTMLDVGANLGVYTLTAAQRVGPSGRVLSVEAIPEIAQALRANIARNGFTWAKVVEAAAGADESELLFYIPAGTNSGAYCGVVPPTGTEAEAAPKGLRVRQRRLDEIVRDDIGVDAPVHLLKMDIEGSEYRALNGAPHLLGNQRPAVLIELNEVSLNRAGSSSMEVVKLLGDAGYTGARVERQGLVPLTPLGADDIFECLFLHREPRVPEHRRLLTDLPRA